MFYALLKNIHYFVAYQITVFLQLKLPHNHQHLNNVDKLLFLVNLQRCVVVDKIKVEIW